MGRTKTAFAVALFGAALIASTLAFGQANLAEGFTKLPAGARIVLMPTDIELFEMSAGGVLEPRADWTSNAAQYVLEGLQTRKAQLGSDVSLLPDNRDEAIIALNRLHGAVSDAIVVHHFGAMKLPTKEGRLDWTLGPDAAEIHQRTGAQYALFTWIRDSYASGARKATMVVGALFGISIPLGVQHAYASLVELKTGRIVWFNRLARPGGDLRERDKAQETLDTLLTGFPG